MVPDAAVFEAQMTNVCVGESAVHATEFELTFWMVYPLSIRLVKVALNAPAGFAVTVWGAEQPPLGT